MPGPKDYTKPQPKGEVAPQVESTQPQVNPWRLGGATALRVVPPLVGQWLGGAGGAALGTGETLATGGVGAPAVPALTIGGRALGGGIGGGGGELLAELLEGRTPNWKQIGVSAGLGAVPGGLGGKYKALRIPLNIAEGAALGGAGVAGNRWAEGQPVDPRQWSQREYVMGPGLGAGLGALTSLLPGERPPSAPKGTPPPRLADIAKTQAEEIVARITKKDPAIVDLVNKRLRQDVIDKLYPEFGQETLKNKTSALAKGVFGPKGRPLEPAPLEAVLHNEKELAAEGTQATKNEQTASKYVEARQKVAERARATADRLRRQRATDLQKKAEQDLVNTALAGTDGATIGTPTGGASGVDPATGAKVRVPLKFESPDATGGGGVGGVAPVEPPKTPFQIFTESQGGPKVTPQEPQVTPSPKRVRATKTPKTPQEFNQAIEKNLEGLPTPRPTAVPVEPTAKAPDLMDEFLTTQGPKPVIEQPGVGTLKMNEQGSHVLETPEAPGPVAKPLSDEIPQDLSDTIDQLGAEQKAEDQVARAAKRAQKGKNPIIKAEAAQPEVTQPITEATSPSVDEANAKDIAELESAPTPEAKQALLEKLKSQGDKGTTLSAFGAGQGGTLREAIRNNPMLAARLGLGAAGALTGAAVDKDDPLSGAIMGGAAGAMLPSAGRAMSKIDLSGVTQKLPQAYQSLLLGGDPLSLANNTIVAPLGLMWTKGAEKLLTGLFSHNPEDIQLGKELLKRVVQSPKRSWDIFHSGAARNVLENSDNNIFGEQRLPGDRVEGLGNKLLVGPAEAITSGHMGIQDLGIDAGLSPHEAADMAFSLEPIKASGNKYALAFGQGLQNLKGTKTADGAPNYLAKFAAPFTRTSSQSWAGAPTRIPGIGALPFVKNMENTPTSWAEIAARQAISAGVTPASFIVGMMTPDANAGQVRKLIRNATGRYSIPASVAFESGRAYNKGKNLTGSIGQGMLNVDKEAPLPTTEVLTDLVKSGTDLAQGAPTVPRFMVPSMLRSTKQEPDSSLVPYDWTTH